MSHTTGCATLQAMEVPSPENPIVPTECESPPQSPAASSSSEVCRESCTTQSTAWQATMVPSSVVPVAATKSSDAPSSSEDNETFPVEAGGILRRDALQPSLFGLQIKGLMHYVKQHTWNGLRSGLVFSRKIHVLVYHRPFDSILQVGPSCGMVALAMLARMLGKEEATTEVIVDHARKRGYTRCGELFSADNARAIAEDMLKARATMETVHSCPWAMCHRLVDNAVLLCYDNSSEGQPSKRNGNGAHWALITGFALVFDVDLNPKQKRIFKDYKTRGMVDKRERAALRQALFELRHHTETTPTLYVLGRTGLSEDIIYWSWQEMVESSSQLREYTNCVGCQDFVLPPEGMAAALSGKLVNVPVPLEVAAFQAGGLSEHFDEDSILKLLKTNTNTFKRPKSLAT